MIRRLYLGLSTVLALAGAGCGVAERAELERARAELAEARAELDAVKAAQPAARPGYLEELERLDALRAKGALTQEEFEGKKKAVLAASSKPAQPLSSMDELAKQLRMLSSLYANGTITSAERDAKKRQLIQNPVFVTDLKKDLESVRALYANGTVTSAERDQLKKRLLEPDQAKK